MYIQMEEGRKGQVTTNLNTDKRIIKKNMYRSQRNRLRTFVNVIS